MEKMVSETLATWAVNLSPCALPQDVLKKAEDVIIDAIACALPGSSTDGAQRVHGVAKSTLFGEGDAALWFEKSHLHPTAAAFANSASVSMLDLDDGHRNALGHPGAAIVPAVLAFAYADQKGIDILSNIVAAYEVCIRVGCSEHQKAYHTGNWSGLGASVAAGLSSGLNAEQLANALATIAYHGPRVSDLTLSQDMGANVKESIPWSVVTGLMANDLAAQGFTGCRDALNIEERYDPVVTLKGLEQGYFESHVGPVSHTILRTYFKRYACCRWIHGSVEALLQIIRQQNISVDEIKSIIVETFMQAANLNNLTDPPSIESAQYSVPYCMAIAAVLGEDALSPATSDCLHQNEIIKFAEKITVKRDEKMDSSFPHNSPSRVSVTTAKGTFVVTVDELWGDPDRNLDRSDLVAKFKTLAHGRLAQTQVAKIVSAVEGLREGKAGPLLKALSCTRLS